MGWWDSLNVGIGSQRVHSGVFHILVLIAAEISLGWQMNQLEKGALLPAVLLLSKYLCNL